MNSYQFTFAGHTLEALSNGGLYWPSSASLIVSDLHLGKSERIARRSGQILPPYDSIETLTRLQACLDAVKPKRVVCLGDSFDDLQAGQSLDSNVSTWITRMMAGREWIWVEGNHDPGPLELGGSHRAEVTLENVDLRHIASAQTPEISGHFHPKASVSGKGRRITRPCFLVDSARIILPAFGAYTGGLHCYSEPLNSLMSKSATAILLGRTPTPIQMPRSRAA